MKPRDAFLSAVRHEEVRPVPYTIGWEGDVGERLEQHYGSPDWHKRLTWFHARTGVVDPMRKAPVEGREGYAKDLFGSVWRMDRRPFHLEEPGMTRPSFEGYAWPAPESFFADEEGVANARKFCDELKGERFLIGSISWGLFEHCWGIRGFQNVMMDVAAEPDFYEELLDRLTEHFLVYVDHTCKMLPDIDAIMFGDDWGDQRGIIIGPERWRKLFKPRWAKIYDRVHSHGKYTISHCCGSVVDIMDDVIEIGLDVFESMQPEARGMDPYALKKRWGDKIAFWGCLGAQSTVPFGEPDAIQAEVRKLCREMGKGGGFILAPAKGFQPETPTENAVAVIEATLNQ
jgi:uroporphyrinogen decarboxylase